LVPGGLNKVGIDFIVRSIISLGFNCVRLPYSLEMYFNNPIVDEVYIEANLPLLFNKKALTIMDVIIDSLSEHNVMVILNNSMSDAGPCCSTKDKNGMWFNSNYPQSKFFEAVKGISERYKAN
jgi:hypothetical protein